MRSLLLVAALSLVSGCSDSQQAAASSPATGGSSAPQGAAAGAKAEVGKPAPDFKLKDLDGKEVSLSSFKGKTVVLEWFNPGCPFVKKSHTKGSLKGLGATLTEKGIVWLSINSGAAGKQGAGIEANKAGAEELGVKNPILLDETGEVGKLYGATNTPHLYVIDAAGVLAYAGAIDNSPDAEGESAPDGKLVNYVTEALAALDAKRPVATPQTKAYGCTVKY